MKEIRMSQLKSDASQYNHFLFSTDSIFSPLNISATFDTMFVNIGASPYICLKKDTSYLCIRYIKSIRKDDDLLTNTVYNLICYDHNFDPPVKKRIKITCEKIF